MLSEGAATIGGSLVAAGCMLKREPVMTATLVLIGLVFIGIGWWAWHMDL